MHALRLSAPPRLATVGCLLAVWCAGCAQPRTPDAVLAKARARLDRNQPERAAAVVARALAAPELAESRAALFQQWLALLLQRGDTGAAERELLARCAPTLDETLVSAGYGSLADVLAGKSDWPALLALTGKLPRAAFSPDFRLRVGLDRLQATILTDAPDAALELLPELLAATDNMSLRQLVGGFADRLIRAGDRTRLAALRAALRAAGATQPAWAGLAAATEVGEAVGRQEWAVASARLQDVLAVNDESSSRGALAGLLQALVAAREEGWIERVCTQTLATATGLPVQLEAATRWLQQASRLAQPDMLLDRLAFVVDAPWPPEIRAQKFGESIYGVLVADDTNRAARALALIDRLAAAQSADHARMALAGPEFDVAFLAQDYARCLALIARGLPGRDAAWSGMASNKVQAHAALRDGRWEEAVARFRAFMEFVDQTWTQPEPDPSTGLRYTREMALGFNARRIGDILLEAGLTNRAAEAFAEAMQLYATALSNAAPDSAEYRHVTNEIGRIPAMAL